MRLCVIQGFSGFNVGDVIDDAETVKRILASEQAHYVTVLPVHPVSNGAGKITKS